jgi:multicomponent Na+:H+ antiporter subunit F
MPGFQVALQAIALVLVLVMGMGAVRIVRGPRLADRVVALDMVSFAATGLIGVVAILTEKGALLDVALVLSLLVFLGTIAFARFLERVRKGGS